MRRLNFGFGTTLWRSHTFFNRSTLSAGSTAPLGEDCYSSDTTSGGFSSASSYEECDSEVDSLVLFKYKLLKSHI